MAFAAGVLSFLSPCVLPLVPSYLGFITGMTLEEMGGRRRLAMMHALLFVFGFGLIFVILGASATALGSALKYYQVWLQRVGGVLIILFGLYALGVFKFALPAAGAAGAPATGSRSATSGRCWWGWRSRRDGRPASGRSWAAILGMAATQGDVGRGMALLGTYSAGLAVPFLVAAWAMESFLDWFQRFRKYLPWVMRASGVLLIFVGLLMVTGEFTRLAGWLQGLTPEFLKGRL